MRSGKKTGQNGQIMTDYIIVRRHHGSEKQDTYDEAVAKTDAV